MTSELFDAWCRWKAADGARDARGPKFVTEADVDGEFLVDLPLILHIREPRALDEGWEDQGEIATELAGPVEEEAGEGVGERGGAADADDAGGVAGDELGVGFVEGEAAAGAEGLVLEQLVAVAAVIDTELDGVIAESFRRVDDEVQVGFAALQGRLGE